MRPRLFLDTGVFIARINPRDPAHRAARRVFDRVGDGEWSWVTTSDYVVAEALNFLTRKLPRAEPRALLLRAVFGGDDAPPAVGDVLKVHSGVFAEALALHAKHLGRRLSFTDCTTLALMRQHRISDVATFDKGFAGLADVVR